MSVHKWESGTGKLGPLIMVHGAGGSSATWIMQLRNLSNSVNVVTIDLNGHGSSSDRQDADTTKSYLDDIRSVVQQYDKPFLAGHSMGGALVQLYALEYPNDLSGIILIGTGARLKVSPIVFDLLDNDYEGYVKAIGKFMFHEGASNEVIEASENEVRKCPAEIARRDYMVCNEFDIMQKVDQISLPTLVIVGQDDYMTPPKYSDYLKNSISNSTLHVVKNAGHSVMLEQYEEVNAIIAKWISSVDSV
ncbi:MAG: alpha/beta fold hydrolase [Candidatus Thorarchaeota archaeon]|jgi:pimeloyl-ACP methyl ester carboxylesterase